MPQTFGTRSERRKFSRDAARHFATTNLRQPSPAVKSKASPTRSERRGNGEIGEIAALVHGPHDRAWLFSGTLNASGQARINHKRNQRAEFWKTFTAQQTRVRHGLMSFNEYQRELGLSTAGATR